MRKPCRLLWGVWAGWCAALLLAIAVPAAAGTPLVSQAPQASSIAQPGPLDRLRGLLGKAGGEADLLPPDEAYQLEVHARDARTLVATLRPAPEYYLYRDRIQFRIEEPAGIAVEQLQLPESEPKQDPNFGKMEIYRQPFEAVLHLSQPVSGAVRLHATYQGCNEPRGVCYPPIEKTFTVDMVASAPAAPTSLGAIAPADGSETSRIRGLFSQGLLPLLAAFLGFGLLLAFTPCMLPMIPILSGIVVGQGAQPSRARALTLSASYVLGMAVTYAAAGVAAGLAGALLSMYLQGAPARIGFAAVFVLLALAMFGGYRFQLPSSLQTALTRGAARFPGGRVGSVFLMGALSALIMGPCVAAPLAGALVYISQTRDAVRGGLALFALAIGMGLPLLVIGATAWTLLRRAAAWAESIQRFFGVVMLGMAIYLLSPVIPLVAQQLLWATLLIVSAMFVHAIDPLPVGANAR